jgi:beta-lactamase regulating signal transducer with metallopeptidase domain
MVASGLDIIVAREFVHIAGRDFAKNLLYGILSVPIARHPLLWLTRAQLEESRELLCDTIASQAAAGEYARSLLRLAAMYSSRAPSQGVTLSQSSTAEYPSFTVGG